MKAGGASKRSSTTCVRNGESETDGLKGKANGKLEVEFRKEDSRIQVALSGFNGSIASETLPKSKKKVELVAVQKYSIKQTIKHL